jgi:hypothetical protein
VSGHDFLVEQYIHRELVCTQCGNDLESDGEESRPRKGETLLIFPCEHCIEEAVKEALADERAGVARSAAQPPLPAAPAAAGGKGGGDA